MGDGGRGAAIGPSAGDGRYRRFFEESLAAVCVVRPGGEITAANPAFAGTFGFSSVDQILEVNARALVQDSSQLESLFHRACTEGSMRGLEAFVTRWDGRRLHLLGSLVVDGAGEGEREITCYCIDLTERDPADERPAQEPRPETSGPPDGWASRETAHDLNNVLAPVLLSVDLLRDLVEDERARRLLTSIEDSARRGIELARRIRGIVPGVESESEPTDGKAPAPEPGRPMPRGRGELILIVDDEPVIRDVCRETLEAFGYRTLTAADGSEGVERLSRNMGEVDAVITDLAMPVMDGPAAIRAMRRLDPTLPILAMSGLAERHGFRGVDQGGVAAFLEKPFSAEELLARLGEALAIPRPV
jgi:PAS domain S-box-containing protein